MKPCFVMECFARNFQRNLQTKFLKISWNKILVGMHCVVYEKIHWKISKRILPEISEVSRRISEGSRGDITDKIQETSKASKHAWFSWKKTWKTSGSIPNGALCRNPRLLMQSLKKIFECILRGFLKEFLKDFVWDFLSFREKKLKIFLKNL